MIFTVFFILKINIQKILEKNNSTLQLTSKLNLDEKTIFDIHLQITPPSQAKKKSLLENFLEFITPQKIENKQSNQDIFLKYISEYLTKKYSTTKKIGLIGYIELDSTQYYLQRDAEGLIKIELEDPKITKWRKNQRLIPPVETNKPSQHSSNTPSSPTSPDPNSTKANRASSSEFSSSPSPSPTLNAQHDLSEIIDLLEKSTEKRKINPILNTTQCFPLLKTGKISIFQKKTFFLDPTIIDQANNLIAIGLTAFATTDGKLEELKKLTITSERVDHTFVTITNANLNKQLRASYQIEQALLRSMIKIVEKYLTLENSQSSKATFLFETILKKNISEYAVTVYCEIFNLKQTNQNIETICDKAIELNLQKIIQNEQNYQKYILLKKMLGENFFKDNVLGINKFILNYPNGISAGLDFLIKISEELFVAGLKSDLENFFLDQLFSYPSKSIFYNLQIIDTDKKTNSPRQNSNNMQNSVEILSDLFFKNNPQYLSIQSSVELFVNNTLSALFAPNQQHGIGANKVHHFFVTMFRPIALSQSKKVQQKPLTLAEQQAKILEMKQKFISDFQKTSPKQVQELKDIISREKNKIRVNLQTITDANQHKKFLNILSIENTQNFQNTQNLISLLEILDSSSIFHKDILAKISHTIFSIMQSKKLQNSQNPDLQMFDFKLNEKLFSAV
jgi:hypothetical protein